jgi:hypothetical protein
VFVLYFVTTGSAVTALYEIMAGGLFLGAIFMATDYQTSPINNKGKAFFALGCVRHPRILRVSGGRVALHPRDEHSCSDDRKMDGGYAARIGRAEKCKIKAAFSARL